MSVKIRLFCHIQKVDLYVAISDHHDLLTCVHEAGFPSSRFLFFLYSLQNMPNIAWDPLEGLRFWNDFNRLNVSYPYGYCPDSKQLELRRAYYACVSYVDAQVTTAVVKFQ